MFFVWMCQAACNSPVAANVLTGAALLSPAEATTLTVYSVPGTRELKPDCVAAEPISLVLCWVPDACSSRITSYQSTYPAERGQKTRSAVEPLRTRGGSNSTRSAVGPTGSVIGEGERKSESFSKISSGFSFRVVVGKV